MLADSSADEADERTHLIDRISKLMVYGLLLALVLASIAIQIPLHNRLMVFNDEGIICGFSESILSGKILYRDIPSYVCPGMFYLLALIFKIFGASLIFSRYAMAIVFSATAILVFLISRKMMAQWLAFLTGLAFVFYRVWAFPIWNMIGYATFAMFLIGIVLFLLIQFNQNPRVTTVFLIGVFVAAIAMFKQDYGAFTAAAIFIYLLLWPLFRSRSTAMPSVTLSRAKIISAYVAGGIMICLPVLAYFGKERALGDLIQNILVIPLTMETKRDTTRLIPLWPLFYQDRIFRQNLLVYSPSVSFMRVSLNRLGGNPGGFIFTNTALWDFLLKLVHYSPYVVLLGVGVVLARKYLRKALSRRFEHMTAVWIVTVFIFMTQHKPFDFAHLMQMYMPIFLMLGCLVDALYSRIKERKALFYSAFAVIGLLFLYYIYQSILAVQFLATTYSAKLEGPRAGVFMRPLDRDACRDAIRFIQANTAPEDPIFVFPYHSLLYFLCKRPNPTRFYLLWPIKIFPFMDEEIIAVLEQKQVQYLIYSPNPLPSVGTFERIAPKIAEYVKHQYRVKEVFGDQDRSACFIILERKIREAG